MELKAIASSSELLHPQENAVMKEGLIDNALKRSRVDTFCRRCHYKQIDSKPDPMSCMSGSYRNTSLNYPIPSRLFQ